MCVIGFINYYLSPHLSKVRSLYVLRRILSQNSGVLKTKANAAYGLNHSQLKCKFQGFKRVSQCPV